MHNISFRGKRGLPWYTEGLRLMLGSFPSFGVLRNHKWGISFGIICVLPGAADKRRVECSFSLEITGKVFITIIILGTCLVCLFSWRTQWGKDPFKKHHF